MRSYPVSAVRAAKRLLAKHGAARLALLLSLAVNAAHAETVLIAAEDSWPPFSDASGHGISFNLVSAAYARVGQQIEIQVVPYARALYYTETGKVNACWNVTRQASTESTFVFGNEPLLRASASYFYPQGAEHNYSSPESIPDKARIGVIIDYEYGEAFAREQHRLQLVSVPDQRQLIKMLLARRLDAAIMFDKVAEYTLREMQLQQGVIVKGAQNHTSDIYVAFSKKRENSAQLAARLDRGLRELRASGEYQKLLNPPL